VRGPTVRITNRNKVLWPRDGYTKGDLVEYYDEVADHLLPYLEDRPLSLHRFPNGIDQQSFYQKNIGEHVPDWIRRERVASQASSEKSVEFVVCDSHSALLFLANLACVELHPWSSRCGALDQPTWAILDLDPSTDDFGRVVQVARFLGKLLRGLGLRPCVKTSGAKGLHIYIPLTPGYTYDQVRMFCEGIARYAAHEMRDIATVERSKSHRGTKVYLDFMQNRRGQTIVSPYSVRPVRGGQVSAPIEWDELSDGIHPSQFTMETMPPRLASKGDLFRAALLDHQDLLPAIDSFRQLAGGALDQ
jgi:bifunctional non-homologous end joining protein LigD